MLIFPPMTISICMSAHIRVMTQPRNIEKLSGSVTLVLEPTGTDGDVVTVKVTDATLDSDAPTNGKSDPITFTLYSVKYQSNISSTNSETTLGGDGVEYAFDNDVRPLGTYFTFATDAEVPSPLFS